eukprot:TRINITY_DN10364_c0_g1_i1.p1 TRINITY_DN10364_c0_g1~~TRINITY_DN10364_c0_g1_i1.p1  ORF type:complete len:178 (+),score=37.11 TRINITY_DN10364_c0_g1_i1:51-584(+)
MYWQMFLVWLYAQQGKNFVILQAAVDAVTFAVWLAMYIVTTHERYESLCSPHWSDDHCQVVAGQEASAGLPMILLPAAVFAGFFLRIYFFYHERSTLQLFIRVLSVHAYALVLWMVMTIVQQNLWFPFLLEIICLITNAFLLQRLNKLPPSMFGADPQRARNSFDDGSREMTDLQTA